MSSGLIYALLVPDHLGFTTQKSFAKYRMSRYRITAQITVMTFSAVQTWHSKWQLLLPILPCCRFLCPCCAALQLQMCMITGNPCPWQWFRHRHGLDKTQPPTTFYPPDASTHLHWFHLVGELRSISAYLHTTLDQNSVLLLGWYLCLSVSKLYCHFSCA